MSTKKTTKKMIKNLQMEFVGEFGWSKLRDLLILKLVECDNEEDMKNWLRNIMASMFSSMDELNAARKELGKERLEEVKEKIKKEGEKI